LVISTKPFAVVSVMAWFSDSQTNKRMSFAAGAAPPVGIGGVMLVVPAVNVPDPLYVGSATYAAIVIVKLVTDTTAPDWKATELKLQSAPEVPTEKSTMRVPAEVQSVPQVAVPVAFAEESLAIAEAVSTPPEAPGAKVAVQTCSESKTWAPKAVATFVGCV
jgi:hypothetical protein